MTEKNADTIKSFAYTYVTQYNPPLLLVSSQLVVWASTDLSSLRAFCTLHS